MPLSDADNTTNSDHIRFRRPRNQSFSETDPNNITQSVRCKQTISSLLLSSSPPTINDCTIPSSITNYPKKKNFTTASWRGLGCAASSQVSVPAVIRTSADWEAKKVKKKKVRKRSNNNSNNNSSHQPPASNPPSIAMDELWCGPGIGFNSDSAASVDCFVSRRTIPERHASVSVSTMRTMNLESNRGLGMNHHTLMDTFGPRYHRHVRHRSTQGLAEMMMLQGRLLMGARAGGLDQYRDWRLDVDRMSYEELLELGDRIGYVNTGLKEDDIVTCLRKINISEFEDLSTEYSSTVIDHKCSICQEEFETEDEMGELGCGHGFHFHCIEQWLVRKNTCPVCKTVANGSLN
ncbi:uncharacterized protein LOC124931669 [Impatiens glandulifera]|uniref:uncharacterized protein LOC124931669 n=1 Tax=Impatiens glandulifera TaxID=253017 RepID=UPI001FB177CE|nr:uncharacterized protein LOC124931669 [Impatiens glandulifera]